MECNSCKNKEICHMYFRINKYSKYANISITNCKFYNIINSNTNSNTNSNLNSITFKTKDKDYDKIKKFSDENFKKKQQEQNSIKEINNNATPKIREFIAKPLKLDTTCPDCGALTFKEDVLKCDLCGKQICSCCATFNNAQQILCRDCWANY